jgi:hypothetical protein
LVLDRFCEYVSVKDRKGKEREEERNSGYHLQRGGDLEDLEDLEEQTTDSR